MRRKFLAFMVLVCLALAIRPAAAAAETEVRVAAPGSVSPGHVFTVNITAVPGEPLGGMECDLAFNASVLEVHAVEPGGLFEGWWNDSLAVDNDNGTVRGMLGFNYHGNATTAAAPFASVSFEATGEGIGWIRLADLVLSDPAGTESLRYTTVNATVTIENDTVPPTLSYDLSPAVPDGDNGWWITPVTVSVEAYDAGAVASVAHRVDNGSWNTTSGAAATFTVPDGGIHTVSLRATDASGNENTTSFMLPVDVAAPRSSCTVPGGYWRNSSNLSVAWQASDDGGLANVSLLYRYTASNQGEGAWQPLDVGDAAGSSDEGTFNVDLAALDGEGVYRFASRAGDMAGRVEDMPDAADAAVGFDATQPAVNVTLTGTETGDRVYRGNVTVTVTAHDALSGVDRVEYILDGDGWTPYGDAFTVAAAGTHTLSARAVDAAGNAAMADVESFDVAPGEPSADFSYTVEQGRTVSFTDLSAGAVESWHWDFGDGGASDARNPHHTFPGSGSYTVTLTVTGGEGSDSISRTVHLVNVPPAASFTVTPEYPLPGETVTLDGGGSSDGDGSIASWAWRLGDGERDTGRQVTHGYGETGTYTVTLTVTDDDGASDSVQGSVVVNSRPVASFDVPGDACTGGTTRFADASYDEVGGLVNWTWRFGDGGVSHEMNASHVYTRPGTYTVTLDVRDRYGATGSASRQVSVRPEYEFSVADIDYEATLFGGGTVTVSVANAGGRAAENVSIGLSVDGHAATVRQIGRLDANGTATLSFACDMSPLRRHTVTASVDPDDGFPEGNEGNNAGTLEVPVNWLLVLLLAIGVAGGVAAVFLLFRRIWDARSGRRVLVRNGRQVERCLVCRGTLKGGDAGVRCACGALFHMSCARRVGECPDCGRPLDVGDAAEGGGEVEP